MPNGVPERITLRTLKRWAKQQKQIAFLTCYDATTARWLWRGGIRCLLVGDTAGQIILGHETTLPAPVEFMIQITAAVRRGAPDCFIMADMPFGSYQCGEDDAVANAVRFLTEGQADVVKLELDESFVPLVERFSHAGIPVVAHLGSRPQTVRTQGGYSAAGRTPPEARNLSRTAQLMIEAGAVMILLEAVPAEVSRTIVDAATHENKGPKGTDLVPVIGCGAGPACHGHVVVLQDMLGMTDWQPPFVRPLAEVGRQIETAASRWVRLVESGDYLKDDHPYRMKD